jgi:hypothetical protein
MVYYVQTTALAVALFVTALTVAAVSGNRSVLVMLNRARGITPYQVQLAANFSPRKWINVGSVTGGTLLLIAPINTAAFHCILGQ